MTEQKAAELIFPGQALSGKELELSESEVDSIKAKSNENIRHKKLKMFSSAQGVVFIDQVLGKHEFITYAVGIDKSGAVSGIEIIEYRESYGHQIRREPWRKQFLGKTVLSPIKLDEDIKNISGATLSCAHVTGGVRRLLSTYDVIKKRI